MPPDAAGNPIAVNAAGALPGATQFVFPGQNNGATVLGAAGGAFAGNAIEKNARTTKSYEVGVLMEDGSRRTVTLASAPTWRAGDHVRVVNGSIEPDHR